MKIEFVLVEPKVPENIGASARAIKTMGFDSLSLVNPCEWKDGKARWVAHGAYDILEKATVFPNLKMALADTDFTIATSAKQRTVKQDYLDISDLRLFLDSRASVIRKVSLVFGREESGLTNDEMMLCDITSTIPMAVTFPSLNLSQAVMIYAYSLTNTIDKPEPGNVNTDSDSFRNLKARTSNILKMLGIDETDNRYGRMMERISFLNPDDLNLLHSFTSLLIEKLNRQ